MGKSRSHIVGLVIGSILGAMAAIYLKSDYAKKLTPDLFKNLKDLESLLNPKAKPKKTKKRKNAA